MSDNKITQDQLEPNVMEELESGIGDLSTLRTENKDSLVAAVTEIYGKNIIAEAIGEPLAVTDTFSEMGNEINSLLSNFKTNMMNSGVTVESGDRFKQLIEKIKGLTEGEGNKGIQYAEGIVKCNTNEAKYFNHIDGNGATASTYVEIPKLNFNPTIIIVSSNEPSNYYPVMSLLSFDYNFNMLSVKSSPYSGGGTDSIANNFKADGLVFLSNSIHIPVYNAGIENYIYTAIGVGEEDTTLRDSLASILQEEGVNVTEEDDMASLISKVDEEFDRQVVPQGNATAADVIAGKSFINDTGQLLTGTATLQSLGGEKSKQLIKNWNFTDSENFFMIKNDGSLWAYGYNNYGQLGLGDKTNRNTFTKVTTNINNDVKQVACGMYHTFILKNDGSVWCCGYNGSGQLGLGDYDTDDHITFTKVTTNVNNDVKELLCFDNKTYIIKNDDSIWVTGLMFDYSQTTFMKI